VYQMRADEPRTASYEVSLHTVVFLILVANSR